MSAVEITSTTMEHITITSALTFAEALCEVAARTSPRQENPRVPST